MLNNKEGVKVALELLVAACVKWDLPVPLPMAETLFSLGF
jgi:hypothetical protein